MKTQQIRSNLFSIENVIPSSLIKELHNIDLYSIPFTKQEWQEDWPRRKILYDYATPLHNIHDYLNSNLHIISNAIEKDLYQIEITFWLDTEGFGPRYCPAHFDNPGVKNVMQLYLSNCSNMGTVFYKTDDIILKDDDQHYHYEGVQPPTEIIHNFSFIENTGYIMTDNDKIPHLHGVPNTLESGDIRLSVYCYLLSH